MKMGTNLFQWLQVHGITRNDLLCIAFVPLRTYEDFSRGTGRSIPALYRLYLTTELAEFRLTPDEVKKYQTLRQKDLSVQMDEKIAVAFIARWKTNSILPTGDERLMLGRKKQIKSELAKKLAISLFQTTSDGSNLVRIFSELEGILSGPEDAMKAYLKQNASLIKALGGIINIIITDNPKKALTNPLNRFLRSAHVNINS